MAQSHVQRAEPDISVNVTIDVINCADTGLRRQV